MVIDRYSREGNKAWQEIMAFACNDTGQIQDLSRDEEAMYGIYIELTSFNIKFASM